MNATDSRPCDGWLNILKPPGMTSHDVVAAVRRLAPKGTKVGHIGTLDPDASGVLPLCLGKATRLSRFTQGHEKTYLFEAVFGIETDTLDAGGEITRTSSVNIAAEDVEAVLPRFIGVIEQRPPKFSAVHYAGRRAYRLAQQGEEFTLPARTVTIHALRLLDFRREAQPAARFEVICSSGTYIRSLCADLGSALGCGAHVALLVRKAVGPFRLEQARTLEELQQGDISQALLPLDWPLEHLPAVALSPEQAWRFCAGTALEGIALAEPKYFRVYIQEEGALIGIGNKEDTLLKPEVVISSAQIHSL